MKRLARAAVQQFKASGPPYPSFSPMESAWQSRPALVFVMRRMG
jgi:hypothetical protein